MANVGPAKLTITSTTGPGQAVTALIFTDVQSITVNFGSNTISVTRGGGTTTPATQFYDYSAMNTVTWTISGGATTIAISS